MITRKLLRADPMPHQQQIFDVLGELFTPDECHDRNLPVGTPAYREIVVTMMRQTGKTTSILVPFVDRSVYWGPNQRIIYSAQNGKEAREKLLDDMVPVLEASPTVKKHLKRVLKGVGSEKVSWKNGSTWKPLNSSESSGHGKTLDMAAIDEAFADLDDTREQAVRPAMATKTSAQLLVASTKGEEGAVYFDRKIEDGRRAVAADSGEGLAFFEWSAPDDADPYDPRVWRAAHPALGYTIHESVISHDAATMKEREFKRSWLNMKVSGGSTAAISNEEWARMASPSVKVAEPVRFAFDVATDRSRAAIAVAGKNETAELVDYRQGVEWLPDRLRELKERWGCPIVFDGRGPAASIEVADGVTAPVNTQGMFGACERFIDAARAGTVRVQSSGPLGLAVSVSAVRWSGDRRAWSRVSSDVDASPLVAVSLALFASDEEVEPAEPFII